MTPPKVTKATRAGKNGKIIYCPKCGNGDRVYTFDWIASTCQSCWQLIDKLDWFLEAPDKASLPHPLPPYFTQENADLWKLRYGDGMDSGLHVVLLNKRDWGPCAVIDANGGKDLHADSIAAAKTLALETLHARRKA